MGRLNSTRLVLLHFSDPVIVLTVCLKFVRHFQVVHFQRPQLTEPVFDKHELSTPPSIYGYNMSMQLL